MTSVKKYIESNKDRFIEELFSLIRIPSISAKHEHKPDMEACAKRWTELLLAAGADKAVVMQTEGNPVVYGEKMVSPEAQTVLVYSHYDVMPAEPFDLWKSRPFEPEIRDGRIWARGADDDKGQAMMQVKGFETALNLDLLKCNVKFIFEGEEEIGSPSLEAFCRTHKELLKADVILVSDTSMVSAETPSLTTGLRGLAYWEIEVTGPNRDLHSGHFGGAVANPINVLCKLMADITVVLQNDVGNFYSPTLIVATLTSKAAKKYTQPTHCLLVNEFLSVPSIVQAEQIFTVDKSRVLKFLGHLTPEEMSRVDDAVRASLALNPMGSIQRLSPIIRSTAAYAPPEVVDGKPPIYPYTPIKSSFEDAGSVEDMMLYTELEAAVHAMIQRLEYSFTFNPSLLTIPKRKQQVAEILKEAETYIWRIKEEMRCA